jgi:hypothetical protein
VVPREAEAAAGVRRGRGTGRPTPPAASDGPPTPCYLAPVRKLPALLAVASSLAALATASPALADASSWVFLGGGAMGWRQSETVGINPAGTMVVDVGAGTSPDASVIFGGLFRFQPILPGGVDLALLARFCTHGYQAGEWGIAIDAGGFARPWGYLSYGVTGSISLGMPLGITLMIQAEDGIDHAVAFGAVAGIDLLRLTVYRQTLLKWWQNPSPAWKKAPTADDSTPSHF